MSLHGSLFSIVCCHCTLREIEEAVNEKRIPNEAIKGHTKKRDLIFFLLLVERKIEKNMRTLVGILHPKRVFSIVKFYSYFVLFVIYL